MRRIFFLHFAVIILLMFQSVYLIYRYYRHPCREQLHFIYGLWDITPLPEHYATNVDQWKRLGFKVHVWNKQEVEGVVDEMCRLFPKYKRLYDEVPFPVMKADIARLMIIYLYGGTYMDLDTFPMNNSLYTFLKYSSCSELFLLESENSEAYARNTARIMKVRGGIPEKTKRYSNFAFFSLPLNTNLLWCLDLILERWEELSRKDYVFSKDYEVLFLTGPDIVTEMVYHAQPETLPHTWFVNHVTSASWRM